MKISYLSLLGGLTLAAASSSALACSTCKCGDPTITLLGSEKAFSGRFRLGLDLLWRSETQGADNNPRQITTDESRAVLGVAYSASERLSFALQMPYVEKTITRRDFSREQGRALAESRNAGTTVCLASNSQWLCGASRWCLMVEASITRGSTRR